MPAVALGVFVTAALPRAHYHMGHLGMGAALLLVYWYVEWQGAGSYERRVPRHWLVTASRALWLPGLVLCVLDATYLHWTPWQGPAVKAAGVAVYLAGVGARVWSMRALGESFSYDLKVAKGQRLVTTGPYRWVRHPSYTGLVMWSAGIALWNASLPGLAALMVTTVPQVVVRMRIEERMLADHFGRRWEPYERRTRALVPGLW
jgi:protein-S-isoprenylcysteine O-methyltransferase Ste14